MESKTPVLYSLTTFDSSFGWRRPQDLIESSAKRIYNSLKIPPIEIIAFIGTPLAGKSTLLNEVERIISGHVKINERWDEPKILRSAFEDGLPKKNRTYDELEYHQASNALGVDIIEKLNLLQTKAKAGYLLVELPAIIGLKLVLKDFIGYEIPIGYERGNTVLYHLTRHSDANERIRFQGFKYEVSIIHLASEADIQSEGIFARRYLSDQSGDAEVIRSVFQEERLRIGLDTGAGGASPEQAKIENYRLQALIRLLDSMGVIKLPNRNIDNFALRSILECYMPYYFKSYLRLGPDKVFSGLNLKFS